MASNNDHVFRLVIVAAVLAIGWYVSRESLGMAMLVILVGIGVTYRRPVLGIPLALAAAIVGTVAPWAVLVIIVFAALLTFAAKAPDVASAHVNPMVGMSAVDGDGNPF
jgi:hypothetical protein